MNNLLVLIVDDEASQREILSGYLKKKKHSVHQASSVQEAIVKVRSQHFDLVLTDYKMPGKTGFDLLQEIKKIDTEAVVVLMTAFGTIEGAVEAMRAGAYDYLGKPIELDEIDLLIQRLQERRQLISENRSLRQQLVEKFAFTEIVSQSAQMQEVLSTASRVAQTNAPVLIRGESGTGKELIARAIHFNSARSGKPFIAVNCAALNDNLLESELFGHERGHLPVRRNNAAEDSNLPMAERYFWMRSATYRRRHRCGCCVCCRSSNLNESEDLRRFLLMSASLLRRIKILKLRLQKENFGKISSTG
jgi:two-component system NtrC family response regulator